MLSQAVDTIVFYPLELYPGDDLYINITYDPTLFMFNVDMLPSKGETFQFQLDTSDEYALMSKATISGAMTTTFGGFIPIGKHAQHT